ncbi:hypothetical protein RRG08_007112 [Elysia crispata]|uniref:Uncharacterized protein n=1 Tax=Elysia crispata TaxID=231223 RepID=A0AAE0ZYD3_9GAST|nr:hypothetical protein RRG08_007112 [Elysia crispata]
MSQPLTVARPCHEIRRPRSREETRAKPGGSCVHSPSSWPAVCCIKHSLFDAGVMACVHGGLALHMSTYKFSSIIRYKYNTSMRS